MVFILVNNNSTDLQCWGVTLKQEHDVVSNTMELIIPNYSLRKRVTHL